MTVLDYARARTRHADSVSAELERLGLTGPTHVLAKPVIVNGQRYASTSEAVWVTGISESTIGDCCAEGKGFAMYWPRGFTHQKKNLRRLEARYV